VRSVCGVIVLFSVVYVLVMRGVCPRETRELLAYVPLPGRPV
jgi:hypothetical protein